MMTLREFKEKNCVGCFYNGWLGRIDIPIEKLFCAYNGRIQGHLEDGECLVRSEQGNREMLRG